MKIVIDISEDTYSRIKSGNYTTNSELGFAIQRGVVLPKGHGRLVDENPIIAELVYRKHLLADDVKCGQVTEIFDSAVVVEADKENIDMEAKITKSSDWDWEDKKTFKTLEELQDFIKENGNQVVVTFREETNTWEVEIYDDYRE